MPSPSSRRAWIEIISADYTKQEDLTVALLAEGVDRNPAQQLPRRPPQVALLAEGVDRNAYSPNTVDQQIVALLAEGVDRNTSL